MPGSDSSSGSTRSNAGSPPRSAYGEGSGYDSDATVTAGRGGSKRSVKAAPTYRTAPTPTYTYVGPVLQVASTVAAGREHAINVAARTSNAGDIVRPDGTALGREETMNALTSLALLKERASEASNLDKTLEEKSWIAFTRPGTWAEEMTGLASTSGPAASGTREPVTEVVKGAKYNQLTSTGGLTAFTADKAIEKLRKRAKDLTFDDCGRPIWPAS